MVPGAVGNIDLRDKRFGEPPAIANARHKRPGGHVSAKPRDGAVLIVGLR